MLKVRFPNGQCITYNDAYYCFSTDKGHSLYESKDKEQWFVSVPLACIVEAVDPCHIENPMIELTLDKAFSMIIDVMRNKKTNHNLSHIKKLLKDYNASICEWK